MGASVGVVESVGSQGVTDGVVKALADLLCQGASEGPLAEIHLASVLAAAVKDAAEKRATRRGDGAQTLFNVAQMLAALDGQLRASCTLEAFLAEIAAHMKVPHRMSELGVAFLKLAEPSRYGLIEPFLRHYVRKASSQANALLQIVEAIEGAGSSPAVRYWEAVTHDIVRVDPAIRAAVQSMAEQMPWFKGPVLTRMLLDG